MAGTDNSYFFVNFVGGHLLHAGWKFDSAQVETLMRTALRDPFGEPLLFLEVCEAAPEGELHIETIPVHGRENQWHVFADERYAGKKIIFKLACSRRNGALSPLAISAPVRLPEADERITAMLQSEKDRRLYELTGAFLRRGGPSGSRLSS